MGMGMADENPDLENGEAPDARGADEREDQHREQVQSDDEAGQGADETSELDEDEDQDEIDASTSRAARRETTAAAAREAIERASVAEREARELRERLERLERAAQAPSKEAEPTPEEMALWPTDQLIDYKLGKAQRENDARIAQMQHQQYEAGDKAGFDGYCEKDPLAKKMAAQVETRYQQLRQRGFNVSRGDVYTFMRGEQAIMGGRKATETARAEGERRIRRQQTSGGSPKGDQPRRGNAQLSETEARNQRLRERGFFNAE